MIQKTMSNMMINAKTNLENDKQYIGNDTRDPRNQLIMGGKTKKKHKSKKHKSKKHKLTKNYRK